MRSYTYLLKSRNHKWYYIGSTKDLRTRFRQHNSGQVKSTKFYKPLDFDLVYYESYADYSLARKRELELKKNSQQKEILFSRLQII